MDHGTIYAWSDRLEGPYQEFKDDNVLIADVNGAAAGISCRSVQFNGKTYVFYTERFPDYAACAITADGSSRKQAGATPVGVLWICGTTSQ